MAFCPCRRTLKSKMYHFTRAAKDHEGRTKKDREDIRRLERENDELKEQVADCLRWSVFIHPCLCFSLLLQPLP